MERRDDNGYSTAPAAAVVLMYHAVAFWVPAGRAVRVPAPAAAAPPKSAAPTVRPFRPTPQPSPPRRHTMQ